MPDSANPGVRGSRPATWIWLLALGYFVFYVPYSGLTKALSAGLLPGLKGPIDGFELLPAVALGSMLAMPLFLTLGGWWKYAGKRRVLGVEVPFAGRWTLVSALAAAVIIGTTTLNYTFAGVSIVFVLLLMRGGVLVVSPIVDRLMDRDVAWYSWTALAISLTAVAIALADVGSYRLSLVATLNLVAYLGAYVVRFQIMGRKAKVRHEVLNRRYFVEEHMIATPALVGMVALLAVAGQGEIMLALRRGFTEFLFSPASIPALGIGFLYEGLFIFGSLIYLDRREFSYCVPVNRASSLVAGLVAALVLAGLFGLGLPPVSAILSLALILIALTVLGVAPQLERRERSLVAGHDLGQKMFLFVCGGNTARSPMAAAICRAEIAGRLGLSLEALEEAGITVASAGVDVDRGACIADDASRALRGLGVEPPPHRTQALTRGLIRCADAIFCMEQSHCDAVTALIPEAVAWTARLDRSKDLEDPHGQGTTAYTRSAKRLQELIVASVDELLATSPQRLGTRA